MDYQRQSNGLLTFFEHYWFLTMAVSVLVGTLLLNFFTRLTGAPWIWCYGVGLLVAAVGAALIFYSKLPLYRQRRFFTFGSAALPEGRRSFYRWGYRCVLFAVALLLCLFLSKP
jgi:MFS family permease